MAAVAAGAMSFWDCPDSMAFTPFLKRSEGLSFQAAAGNKTRLSRAMSVQTLQPLTSKPVLASDLAYRVPATGSTWHKARQAPANLPPLNRNVAADLSKLQHASRSAMEEDLDIPALRVATPATSTPSFGRSRSAATFSSTAAYSFSDLQSPTVSKSSEKAKKSSKTNIFRQQSAVAEAEPVAELPQACERPAREAAEKPKAVEAVQSGVAEKAANAVQEAPAGPAVSSQATASASAAPFRDEPAFRRVRPGELLIIPFDDNVEELENDGEFSEGDWDEDTEDNEDELMLELLQGASEVAGGAYSATNWMAAQDSDFELEEEEV
eukprot:TRINITY_DN27190_c0_g2_i1.p1 TRINITY_DN27190_c0_g2~~TRINITY_DN27190_c0_g2_i1.p1  ORF type:complete len:324 (-),score=91.50 TRINITY_DN27190_c0_g2_i1:181-1152(-)